MLDRVSIFLLQVSFKFHSFDIVMKFLVFDEAIDPLDLMAHLALDRICRRVLEEEITCWLKTMV